MVRLMMTKKYDDDDYNDDHDSLKEKNSDYFWPFEKNSTYVFGSFLIFTLFLFS